MGEFESINIMLPGHGVLFVKAGISRMVFGQESDEVYDFG